MSWWDRLLGRGKKAEGEGPTATEGMQEQEPMPSERVEQAEQAAQQEGERAAEQGTERMDSP
jgi:hypothetical protein